MQRSTTLLAIVGFIPALAVANGGPKYECKLQDLVRRVEVVYTTPGSAVPCEVHYYKDTEASGETQVLWTAQNEIRYCETRASGFVDKLSGWGWACEEAGDDSMGNEAVIDEPAVSEDDLVEPES